MLHFPRYSIQPATQRPLDREHPLAVGLVYSAYNCASDYASAPVNYVTYKRGTSSTVTGIPTGGLRVAPKFNGTTSFAKTAVLDLSATKKVTLSFHLWWDVYAGGASLPAFELSDGVSSVSGGFQILPDSGGTFDIVLGGPSSTLDYVTIAQPSAAAWHAYSIEFDRVPSTAQVAVVYVDGVAVTRTTFVDTLAANSVFASTFAMFCMASANGSHGAGRLSNINIHNRLLSASEAAALAVNPSQILLPPSRLWILGTKNPPIGTAAARAGGMAVVASTSPRSGATSAGAGDSSTNAAPAPALTGSAGARAGAKAIASPVRGAPAVAAAKAGAKARSSAVGRAVVTTAKAVAGAKVSQRVIPLQVGTPVELLTRLVLWLDPSEISFTKTTDSGPYPVLLSIGVLHLAARAGRLSGQGVGESTSLTVSLDNSGRRVSRIIGRPLRVKAAIYVGEDLFFAGTLASVSYGQTIDMVIEA